MDIANHTFYSSQKKSAILKSLLWNSVVEIFKKEKNIDISEKIISIKKSEKIFRITTNNPLLQQEFLYIENHISEVFHKKLSKI
jgi:spore coat polysaccharide biosynthesis protein SpsF (cytidylyltransferase family)